VNGRQAIPLSVYLSARSFEGRKEEKELKERSEGIEGSEVKERGK
jgi:hypothetical protein